MAWRADLTTSLGASLVLAALTAGCLQATTQGKRLDSSTTGARASAGSSTGTTGNETATRGSSSGSGGLGASSSSASTGGNSSSAGSTGTTTGRVNGTGRTTGTLSVWTGEGCTPGRYGSCDGAFCDWHTGNCTSAFDCLLDSDCPLDSWTSAPVPAPFCDPTSGRCVGCITNADCIRSGDAASGESHCSGSYCDYTCASDDDCIGNSEGPACVGNGGASHCSCRSSADCEGNRFGSTCITDPASTFYGFCGCSAGSCLGSEWCGLDAGRRYCSSYCTEDAQCPPQYFCDPASTCRPRCDPGHTCTQAAPLCDTANSLGQNDKGVGGAASDARWCYSCLSDGDCSVGEVCRNAYCIEVAPTCTTAADCPDDQGCNNRTQQCGGCFNLSQGSDCPAGDLCSAYLIEQDNGTPRQVAGLCLRSCDAEACSPVRPVCGVLPSLSAEYKYCFGCLQDSDCADGGPGAWCDVSIYRTFTCQPGPT